jgi:hypothetical protein
MPTLEDILGYDDGFEDSYNYQEACENYEEPTWPSWSIPFRRHVMKTIMEYFASIYQKAVSEHSRARSIAYSA